MVATVPFDDQFASVPDYANMYRALGLSPVPARGKQPCIAWMALQGGLTPQETFNRWYGPGGQYLLTYEMGILTGAASAGVFVVDIDVKHGPAATDWWQGLLAAHNNRLNPPTPISTTPSGGLHILFRAPPDWRAPTIRTDLGVDIRGEGGFSMEAPTKGYEPIPDHEPWTVPILDAPTWLTLAIDQLRSASGGDGHTHVERTPSTQDTTALGVQVDGREQMMRDIVWAVFCDLRRQFPGDTDGVPLPLLQSEHDRAWAKYELQAKSRLTDDGSNADRLEREGRGITAFNEKWANAAAQWDTKLKQEAAKTPRPPVVADPVAMFDPWDKNIVPSFPFRVLPPEIAQYVDYVAQSVGVDPSAVAMTVLATAGGAMTQESRIRMRQTGSFAVPARLWLDLVGDPSTKKSPLIRVVTAPIRAFEEREHRQWKRDFAQWKRDGEDGQPPAEPAQVMFKDTTVEAVAIELARHNRGAIVIFDELASLIGGLEKYGQGRAAYERGFWNEAYNGGWFRQNRATRTKIDIENLCVGMIGAMQPERVGEVANLTTDGLLQRFCPVMMKPGRRGREMGDDSPAEAWDRIVSRLLSMQRQTYVLGPVGRDLLTAVEDDVEDIMGRDEYPGGLRGWAGKLPGVLGSLALVLHVLHSDDPLYDNEVGPVAAQGAFAVLTFLWGHAAAFYDREGDPLGLREVASYLLTSDNERFVTSDIKRNVKSWRDLPRRDFVNRMSALVGWDVVTETGTLSIPAWEINPDWRIGLADRRRSERDRRAGVRRDLQLLRGLQPGEEA